MAKTVTVAIIGYPGCSAWITAGLLELFAIANNARATLGDRALLCPLRLPHRRQNARRRSRIARRPVPGSSATPALRRVDRAASLVRIARGPRSPGATAAQRERVSRAHGPPLEDLREQLQRRSAARAGGPADRPTCDDVLVAGELVSSGVPGHRDGARPARDARWRSVDCRRGRGLHASRTGSGARVCRRAAGGGDREADARRATPRFPVPFPLAARAHRRKPAPKSSARRAICGSTRASGSRSPASAARSPSASARWRANSRRASACRR